MSEVVWQWVFQEIINRIMTIMFQTKYNRAIASVVNHLCIAEKFNLIVQYSS
jgi:hypothetical protein